MSVAKIKSLSFQLIYVEELQPAVEFYTKFFGFKKKFDMSGDQIYGTTGDTEMWIGGGFKRTEQSADHTRSCTMMEIDSASRLFEAMKADGVKLYQESPVEMQDNVFWFQFQDPAGNILELL
ncbi:hypothetical protein HOF92_05550, partial [bacterium]|nr:hypothetical protein [bacterium]